MNHISAVVSNIQTNDMLSIVEFRSGEECLRMMALGLNMPLKVGSIVILGVKASSVALAKNLSGIISISNQLPCKVESITEGSLLCSVKLKFNSSVLESVITRSSMLAMNIEIGSTITALIKASELSIVEVVEKECSNAVK